MFANRRSSQKPDEDFYAAFKKSFPDVGPSTTSASSGPSITGPAQPTSASLSEAIIDDEPPASNRPFDHVEEISKDHDITPKPFADQWRLTPSLMDPNSFAFSAFANQPPGYYTPTSAGMHNFYHNSVAGDLHTPGMGMNTPLSMPNSLHGLHAHDPSLHYGHFDAQLMGQAQAFQNQFLHQQVQQAQQTFVPPSHFLQHQDSGYAAADDSPHRVTPTSNEPHPAQAGMSQSMPQMSLMNTPYIPHGDKFRFHTTLNAPTAMVRSADEIPITYLNKGQAYNMSIFDTAPPHPHPGVHLKYRTYVRISFEDETQRARPGSCWQLWKEGRGSNEAHQRGGKLLAVEYVDPNQGGDEELRKSQIELEKASFDGFAVTWYPSHRAPGAPDCSISVRFNFLSTDFSHSKGVKGIPVRLCAKTELITPVMGQTVNEPEVCFSKVKLFRDHGAERKLSNDVAHVKKSIDKMKQQIAQAESGMANVGKRKRSGSMAKGDAAKLSAEEDLHLKLMSLQDMFSSTRPVSVLFLKGDPEDDPDLFPVKLPGGEEVKPVVRAETWESRQSGSESPGSNVSPTPTSDSLTPKRKHSEMQQSAIAEEPEEEQQSEHESSMSPGRPVKRVKQEHATTKVDILALDVDDTYKPPKIERSVKPVACFYVKQANAKTPYYRAVYLPQRTVKDLINGISEKFDIDSHRIIQVFHITSKGLRIIVDEDVVRELPEGQDMMVEFASAKSDHHTKPEYISASMNSTSVGGDMTSGNYTIPDALEMWLNY